MSTEAKAKAKPQTTMTQKKSGTSSSAKPAAPIAKAAAKTPAAKPASAKPQPLVVKASKPVKPKKIKMVRDSMSIPKDEYAVLQELKLRAIQLGLPVKKTEVLRAGIKTLAALSDAALLASLKAVPSLKTGRPAKNG